jgi:2-polyprenyl-3-methyl-5-hydroxy-6-metoxy-1,4-benzoquinol methylase
MGHPVVENGVIAGNFEDKYASGNPISRYLMHRFLSSVTDLASQSACKSAVEVGCGEGKLAIHLKKSIGLQIEGTDFSPLILEQARANAAAAGVDVPFRVLDLNGYKSPQPLADLVVCCEVLEHLEDPEAAVAQLARVAAKRVILSVPREPIWRTLNMARGKYWGDLGNTPGHLQNWSRRSFLELVGRHLDVLEVRTPLPWTQVLAKPRGAA